MPVSSVIAESASAVLVSQNVQPAAFKARSSSAEAKNAIQGQADSNMSQLARQTSQVSQSIRGSASAALPKDAGVNPTAPPPSAGKIGGLEIIV